MAISLSLPANSQIKVIGITNSGMWTQRIVVNGTKWTGTGSQNNNIVGTCVLEPDANTRSISIDMAYSENGNTFLPSAMILEPFSAPGLEGYVVGGQDGGERSKGPAYWNTMTLVYWSKNY